LEDADALNGSSKKLPATGPVSGPPWQALLERPDRGDRIALVYQDDGFLVESVRRFIESGLRSGDGIVVLGTRPRWEAIRQQLGLGGVDVASAAGGGQLKHMGVHNILLNWMSGNCSQAAFDRAAGALVDIQLRQYPTVRVFSELADALLEKDNRLLAADVQRGWNTYVRGKPVSVLSPWRIDSQDAEKYGTRLQSLYLTHNHVAMQHL
jgi:hypothetical protein